MNDGFLSAQGLIEGRLASFVPGTLKAIKGVQELNSAYLNPLMIESPTAFVYFQGPTVASTEPNGFDLLLQQSWGVCVGVRNVTDQIGGKNVRDDASPILTAVLRRLFGWKPSAHHSVMLFETPPLRPVYVPGAGFFFLSFTTRCTFTPEPEEESP